MVQECSHVTQESPIEGGGAGGWAHCRPVDSAQRIATHWHVLEQRTQSTEVRKCLFKVESHTDTDTQDWL